MLFTNLARCLDSDHFQVVERALFLWNNVLTGKHFFGGSTLMQDLLESEGVTVVEDQIQEFQKHLWDPMEHLNQEEFLEDLI